MAHLVEFPAAVDGKHRGSNANRAKSAIARRLILAVVALFVTVISGSASFAQTGPFAGMAGNWSGGGTITLDDGSSERIRCRATYAVGAGGNGLNQTLTCASDSYKINLATNVMSEGGALTGTWSEATRGVSGTIQGHGSNGSFQAVASSAGFNANITLATHGNKQSVMIRADGPLRAVSLSLSRS